MKQVFHIAAFAIGLSGLIAGCASPDFEIAAEGDELDELATLEQPLCENKGGTNAVMTSLAVAAGRELRRWKPETDFRWNSSTGRLELSSTGLSRCGGGGGGSCTDIPPDNVYTCAQQAGWGKCNESWMVGKCDTSCGRCSGGGGSGSCVNTQAMLDMQKPEAHGKVKFPGNITLDATLLRSQLKSNWDAQASCNSSGACSAPEHDLKYTHVEAGSCDKKFFFDPLRAGSTTWLSTVEADRLKNKLKFVGYPGNKMLNFYLRNGQVSVDPTYGLNEGTTVTAGSCDATCTKFSPSDQSGKCCSCNGVTKRFVRSPFSTAIYLCNG